VADAIARSLAPLLGRWRAHETLGRMAPGSDLIDWLGASPVNDAEVYTLYHPADPMVPAEGATLPWATNVQAPVGTGLAAHHQLLLSPANLNVLADLLDRGPAADILADGRA